MDEYWKNRASSYDKHRWVKDKQYLQGFLEFGLFQRDDHVLDVGTGAGTVAKAIAPFVKKVTAIDNCPEMLHLTKSNNTYPNVTFMLVDIRKMPYESNSFDKITARMVFHHLLEDIHVGIQECERVLKDRGIFVFSEGVPPDERTKPLYEEIFKLKENRITFMPEDIEKLLLSSGLHNIRMREFTMRSVSVKDWLEKSKVSEKNTQKILELHRNSDDHFKKMYNLKLCNGGDVLIDWKFIIARGEK